MTVLLAVVGTFVGFVARVSGRTAFSVTTGNGCMALLVKMTRQRQKGEMTEGTYSSGIAIAYVA